MPPLLLGMVWYVVFVISVTLHEAAHAGAALLGGDETAYRGGQVSLNPVPHIQREPLGMVAVPLITVVTMGFPIGWASAPFDPTWAMRHPKRSGWMSLAGPAANLLLVLITGGLLRLGFQLGLFDLPSTHAFGFHALMTASGGFWHATAVFLSTAFTLNLLLGIFNLIPVPPLDGSGAVTVFLDNARGARYLRWIWSNQHLALLGLVFAWVMVPKLFSGAFIWSVAVLYLGTGFGLTGGA